MYLSNQYKKIVLERHDRVVGRLVQVVVVVVKVAKVALRRRRPAAAPPRPPPPGGPGAVQAVPRPGGPVPPALLQVGAKVLLEGVQAGSGAAPENNKLVVVSNVNFNVLNMVFFQLNRTQDR